MTKKFVFIFVFLAFSKPALAKDFDSRLSKLLKLAYKNNMQINASRSRYEAESSLVSSKATLDDPMIGISNLDRGNETTYGVISQKIRFPTKYYVQGKSQRSRALAHKVMAEAQQYSVRKKVISTYYSLFSLQKVIELTEANMQAVREFSRVAERKYAAGRAPQADSMKAHFELTGLELELIRFKQKEEATQVELKALINDQDFQDLKFNKVELKSPTYSDKVLKITLNETAKLLKENSPKIKTELHKLDEAQWNSALAKWEFAPDFQVQYQKRMSGQPQDSEIYSVSMSFPLWFWKKGSEASAASSKKIAQEYRVRGELDIQMARIKNLRGKVEVGAKTLKIYKTSLIPQAQGAYNSAKAAYRANKSSFLNLLDSERSLFKVRTGYYQSLAMYVKQLTSLEAELGMSLSDLAPLKRGQQ